MNLGGRTGNNKHCVCSAQRTPKSVKPIMFITETIVPHKLPDLSFF